MPIYEFYCARCHTLFDFLARRIETRKRPACPRCGRADLERRASTFAVSSGGRQDQAGDLPEGADPRKMEQAMEGLALEAGKSATDDPQALAGVMRRFYEHSGMALGEGLDEALRRLESGEDPETIESEMGDVLEAEDLAGGAGRARARLRLPRTDPELHEL